MGRTWIGHPCTARNPELIRFRGRRDSVSEEVFRWQRTVWRTCRSTGARWWSLFARGAERRVAKSLAREWQGCCLPKVDSTGRGPARGRRRADRGPAGGVPLGGARKSSRPQPQRLGCIRQGVLLGDGLQHLVLIGYHFVGPRHLHASHFALSVLGYVHRGVDAVRFAPEPVFGRGRDLTGPSSDFNCNPSRPVQSTGREIERRFTKSDGARAPPPGAFGWRRDTRLARGCRSGRRVHPLGYD